MTEFSNIPFFVERAHYSTRVNQAFRNPSPLCANWQSPAEEFHNNFDDIYSAFFLYFLLSFSFLPFENETRSVGIIVTFVARRNSTTNGCEMEASIRGGSRLFHFKRGFFPKMMDRIRIVAFSRPMNCDWKKLISLGRVLRGENKIRGRKIDTRFLWISFWSSHIGDNRRCHIWFIINIAVHLLFLTNE